VTLLKGWFGKQTPLPPASSITGWGTDTLVISFSTPLDEDAYTVKLDGSATIRDLVGNALDGEFDGDLKDGPSGNGVAGGDFVAMFRAMRLTRDKASKRETYTDADGDQFRLDYTGAGSATVVLAAAVPQAKAEDVHADIHSILFKDANARTKLTSTLMQASQVGQGRTTVNTVNALNQALGTLDLSLEASKRVGVNRTSILGDVTIGGGIVKFAVGGDVLGEVNIVGVVKAATIGGTLNSEFTATGDINSLIAGSLGVNAAVNSTHGSIKVLRTTAGALNGTVFAHQSINDVKSAGGIGATLEAAVDIKSVFATGNFTGELQAGRDVGNVKAAAITDATVQANRKIASVKALTGGIADTEISAGLDLNQGGSIGTVSAAKGQLDDVLIVAGVMPGPDNEYGRFPGQTGQATDNPHNDKSRISSVSGQSYAGEVRVIEGSTKPVSVKIGRRTVKVSEQLPAGALTLIRTVGGKSAVV